MSRAYRHIYTKSKAVDKSCRNHGDCAYCRHNRLHQRIKIQQATDEEIKYYRKQ